MASEGMNMGGGFGGGPVNFAGIGGAVGDIFGAFGSWELAKGNRASAGFYRQGAGLARENATLAKVSADIQEFQEGRKIYKAIGGQQADVAGAGFAASGTALDLLRDSTAQGALAKGLIDLQGHIQENAYMQQAFAMDAQAQAAESAASAAELGGWGSLLKGAIGIGAAAFMFSDRGLKVDVVRVGTAFNGLSFYKYRLVGEDTVRVGMMADEVEQLRPEAVAMGEDGFKRVDYEKAVR
jgi:hypothetical protein